jgi:hypothetical protein
MASRQCQPMWGLNSAHKEQQHYSATERSLGGAGVRTPFQVLSLLTVFLCSGDLPISSTHGGGGISDFGMLNPASQQRDIDEIERMDRGYSLD